MAKTTKKATTKKTTTRKTTTSKATAKKATTKKPAASRTTGTKRVKQTAGTPRPTEEQIRARAFEIYLRRNGGPGDPHTDWIQAEQELIAERV